MTHANTGNKNAQRGAEPLSVAVQIRITECMAGAVDAAAAALGMTRAEYIRHAVACRLGPVMPPAPA